MPNYQNGKIYKVVSDNSSDIYIGSTTESLSRRMSGHRKDYNGYLKGIRKYISRVKQIFDCEDCHIVLIEEYPCDSKEQLFMRERYHIENMTCVNKCVPIRDIKEQKQLDYQKNKERYKQCAKEYRKTNVEKTKERKHEKITCECGSIISRGALSNHRKSSSHRYYIEKHNS
jgi:hypothetical protein